MTMMHHDSRPLAEAKSEAAKAMRAKLHTEIDRHREQGAKVFGKVIANIPRDRLHFMSGAKFDVVENSELTIQYRKEGPETIHTFALSKMCETVGVPRDFLNRLMARNEENDAWGATLAVDILNKHFKHQKPNQDRRLIRSVGTQTRGFLTDSYARLHPGQLIETFATECKKYGLIPYGGHAGDTKFVINATLDRVIEPIKDEVLGIGVVFKESPFGDGATDLSFQLERMWCTNKAIGVSELRKVHLGAKVSFDSSDADKMYQAATESMCMEIRRAMREMMAEEALAKLADGVVKAHESKVTHTQFEAFLKKHLNKSDVEAVKEKYRSTDITELPAGDSWWRASNALSWFANKTEDPEQQYELRRLAGDALLLGAKGKG